MKLAATIFVIAVIYSFFVRVSNADFIFLLLIGATILAVYWYILRGGVYQLEQDVSYKKATIERLREERDRALGHLDDSATRRKLDEEALARLREGLKELRREKEQALEGMASYQHSIEVYNKDRAVFDEMMNIMIHRGFLTPEARDQLYDAARAVLEFPPKENPNGCNAVDPDAKVGRG